MVAKKLDNSKTVSKINKSISAGWNPNRYVK